MFNLFKNIITKRILLLALSILLLVLLATQQANVQAKNLPDLFIPNAWYNDDCHLHVPVTNLTATPAGASTLRMQFTDSLGDSQTLTRAVSSLGPYGSDLIIFYLEDYGTTNVTFTADVNNDVSEVNEGALNLYVKEVQPWCYPKLPGTISGLKFNDLNGNAVRDNNNEGPLSGVEIILTPANEFFEPNGTPISTFTDQDGLYEFDELEAGNYILHEIVTGLWVQTYPTLNNYTHRITLENGEDATDVDFGNAQCHAESCSREIRGYKYEDVNANGQYDFGEQRLAGWTIDLLLADGTVRSTTTTANGSYQFEDVPLGAGAILGLAEHQQPGWAQTQPSTPMYTDIALSLGDPLFLVFGNTQLCEGPCPHDDGGDIIIEGPITITINNTDPVSFTVRNDGKDVVSNLSLISTVVDGAVGGNAWQCGKQQCSYAGTLAVGQAMTVGISSKSSTSPTGCVVILLPNDTNPRNNFVCFNK